MFWFVLLLYSKLFTYQVDQCRGDSLVDVLEVRVKIGKYTETHSYLDPIALELSHSIPHMRQLLCIDLP